ncbi:hypothetical protein [Burkholderia ubonensis]|uniref:hypothetical protein n=1 Tax=Burkholderia ubonensis TaxID=101571 RepID=UPI00076BD3B1|nr:hypothetical protein [Burkholderia ubonensis]KVM40641.1 hypothetical protein WJ54_03730 [Burkholderia ubonensis]
MPLALNQLNALRNACVNNPGGATVSVNLALALPGWNIPANECGCWRWASSGLGTPVNNDPAQMFTSIATGAALNAGSAWANHLPAVNFAAARHAEYVQYDAHGYAIAGAPPWGNWFTSVVDVVARSTCELGNMTPGAGAQANGERYYVFVHYEPVTNGVNNAPNYTHWWVAIHLGQLHGQDQYCCIEMFPGSTNLTFRINNAYALHDNIRVEVTDLSPNHLAVLGAVI